ncbi:MAG: 30S ribosomal protein S9 [Candidatus Harrisonbacteria bacterium]|nr:30S ribosomal protein S9 [Candidatus Harrisonbacteria bacterium]
MKTKERYVEGVGRRKTASARARLLMKETAITINGKSVKDYFKTDGQRSIAGQALAGLHIADQIGASVKVMGGGLTAQAEAVRHAISRALVRHNEEYRKRLRKLGFLTRDSRMVERKKPGLKKARRAPQWSKR